MADEVRVGRIRKYVNPVPYAAPTGVPVGPVVGFLSVEFTWALLRLTPVAGVPAYAIRVWTYEADLDIWTEDPSERQTPVAGEPYTRYLFVPGADALYIQFTALAAGTLNMSVAMT